MITDLWFAFEFFQQLGANIRADLICIAPHLEALREDSTLVRKQLFLEMALLASSLARICHFGGFPGEVAQPRQLPERDAKSLFGIL